MLYTYLLTWILNPVFILSKIWKISYIPLVYLFKLSMDDHNTQAHSHLLSLVYSIITTLITPYSFYLLYNNYWSSILINSKVVEFVFNISISYFVSDLLVGMQYYPIILNENIITSYVHHISYISLLVYGKYYNIQHLFLFGLPYEIPTILLNIGHINKKFRNNIIFGILFFVFRVLYNAFLLYKIYKVYNDLFIFSVFTFILHCNWFSKFVIKYIIK
jgi:hypothetical protein